MYFRTDNCDDIYFPRPSACVTIKQYFLFLSAKPCLLRTSCVSRRWHVAARVKGYNGYNGSHTQSSHPVECIRKCAAGYTGWLPQCSAGKLYKTTTTKPFFHNVDAKNTSCKDTHTFAKGEDGFLRPLSMSLGRSARSCANARLRKSIRLLAGLMVLLSIC